MTTYFGFNIDQRVSSDGKLGTVKDPGYQPDDGVIATSCVPVIFDKNKSTGMINWIKAGNLKKEQ